MTFKVKLHFVRGKIVFVMLAFLHFFGKVWLKQYIEEKNGYLDMNMTLCDHE